MAENLDHQLHQKIGALERGLDDLEKDVMQMRDDLAAARKDITHIRSFIDQTKGGWRTIALVAGVAGSAGALAGKLIPGVFK